MKSGGTIWTWGTNYYGELGDGTTTFSSTPTRMGTPTWGENHLVATNITDTSVTLSWWQAADDQSIMSWQ
ncbi:MAG: RCC1 domain-containing protein [Desulfotomaculaceae bacterium]|nr:RCC1 domain-containing protein [Desulfotomaculaceae bacterium]